MEEEIFVLTPKKAENRGTYLSRCSSHKKMKSQFPNMKERLGTCLNAFNTYYKYWSRMEDFTDASVLGDCITEERAKGLDYKEAYARCASKVVVKPVDDDANNIIIEPVE